MSQTTTGVVTKVTGNSYTAAEFNSVNDTVNSNAGDALSKGDTSDQAIASNLNFDTGKGVSFDGGDVHIAESGSVTTTATPRTSGTITLSIDDLSYHKFGPEVLVTGMAQVGSVSSPVGLDGVDFDLPFSVADLVGSSGRIGFACTYITGGVISLLPVRGFESNNIIRVQIDASTIGAGDQFWFTFSYLAGA